jgi:hypothetical protein
MAINERIQESLEKLPSELQAEALDFIEYLLNKSEREAEQQREDAQWNDLSLALAMQGLEDEAGPIYTEADLKVVFS